MTIRSLLAALLFAACNGPALAPTPGAIGFDGELTGWRTDSTGGRTGTYTGGYTLTAGTLNFASAGSANAFNGFAAGKSFSVNGALRCLAFSRKRDYRLGGLWLALRHEARLQWLY